MYAEEVEHPHFFGKVFGFANRSGLDDPVNINGSENGTACLEGVGQVPFPRSMPLIMIRCALSRLSGNILPPRGSRNCLAVSMAIKET